MKLFVTGATGFVGSHFVRHAMAAGHAVLASCRPGASGHPSAGLQWVTAELDTLPASHLNGCDALIHFAAVGVSPKRASRREMTYWNVVVPQYLMELAKEAGVRRVIVAGSFAEYGRSADQYDLIPPNAPLLPINAYAASKAACFVVCNAAAAELELELCYLRIFSAFGDGQFESNFWPALRKAALAGHDFEMTAGEQIRDFVPISDVAAAFLRAATRTGVRAGCPLVYNVGSGEPVQMREFATQWWRRWEATGTLRIGALPYRPNEIMRFAPLITESAARKAVCA
jgi:nucleoside-diphosphate-sugar epimerase